MANRWENNGNSDRALFSWALKSLRMVTAAMKLKDAPWKKSYDKPKQHIKRQRHSFANKGPCSQSYGLSSSHVWIWELVYKESWALKNWCFWTVVLEKILESPLDCKEIKPVNLKGNQSWIFIVRTDTEAEPPILWLPDGKSWLTGKDHDAGKDWRQEEKRITEDEMVGWHHQLKGHEFEQALRDGEWQGTLAFCSPQVRKESEATELLNNHNPSRLVVLRILSYAFLYTLAVFSYLKIATYLGSRDSI